MRDYIRRIESRHVIADAWKDGCAVAAGNVWTDGRKVYSYAHEVGRTEPDGTKVAYDCHCSVTTAKHCSAFKEVADTVDSPCPTCRS